MASFPILLAGTHPATTLPASVDYTTVADSTVDGDFEPTSGTATIPVGQREFDVKVQTDVNPPAGDRSFHIQLSNPQNVTLDDNSASCTIHSTAGGGGGGGRRRVDQHHRSPARDPADKRLRARQRPAHADAADAAAVEPAAGDRALADAGRSAKAPADYTAASGDVTWPAGTNGPNPTPMTISINANPATTAPVTFTVAFTSTDATFVGGGSATITIVPAGSTVPFISIADASVAKHAGTAPVAVTMTPAAAGTVTVDYATADGTDANGAKAGTNYTATSGTLTFAPGQTSKTINVPILANELYEPNRDFTVNLSNATGGSAIGVGSATVTIINDVGITIIPPVLMPKKISGPVHNRRLSRPRSRRTRARRTSCSCRC